MKSNSLVTNKPRAYALAFLVLLDTPSLALAATEHGHEAAGFMSLQWYWVNFLLYIAIMFFILRKQVANGWGQRRGLIETAVNRSQIELEAAQQKVDEAEERLAGLREVLERVTVEIAQEANLEAKHILEDARARAERTAKQVQDNIQAENRVAELTIRTELSDVVISKVRGRLQSELNPDSDRALRQAALNESRAIIQH